MKQNLSIQPINLGQISIEKSLLTFRRNYGVMADIVCIGWVIRGGNKVTLIDTGPPSPEIAALHHWPFARTDAQHIDRALAGIGLRCDDIETVILTHLHWDHCYNLEYFQRAEFIVQKSELAYAVAPLPAERRSYEVDIPTLRPPWMQVVDRIIPVDGDVEIHPGISVIHLPGHTPGSQGILVDTKDGTWVIAGDAVPLYDNLEETDTVQILPSGLYQNMFDYHDSLKRLEPFRGTILPGHDARVFRERRYPAGTP